MKSRNKQNASYLPPPPRKWNDVLLTGFNDMGAVYNPVITLHPLLTADIRQASFFHRGFTFEPANLFSFISSFKVISQHQTRSSTDSHLPKTQLR